MHVGTAREKAGNSQLVMGWDRLSLLSKHKNEVGGKRHRVAFLTVGHLKFVPKCIKGCYSLFSTLANTESVRKRRDLLANQLIMGHTVHSLAARHPVCTLTAHLLHTVDCHRPFVSSGEGCRVCVSGSKTLSSQFTLRNPSEQYLMHTLVWGSLETPLNSLYFVGNGKIGAGIYWKMCKTNANVVQKARFLQI